LKGPSLYAFKGLAGRFSPIGVHLAMLLIMAGATLSATGSFRGSVTVPQGLNFVVGDVLGPSGFLSTPTEAFNTEVHVNRFYMDYYDGGDVGVDFLSHQCLYMPFQLCLLEFIYVLHILLYVVSSCRSNNFTLTCHYLTLMGRRL